MKLCFRLTNPELLRVEQPELATMFENPPEGFEISVARDMDSVTYEWSTLGTGSRRKVIKFLTGVFGVSFGLAFAASVGLVIFERPLQPFVFIFPFAFGIGWLQALWGMRIAFKGGRPERVILGEDQFTYDPGGSRMTCSLAVWGGLTTTYPNPIELYGRLFRSRKPVELEAGTIPEFVLDRSSLRQRLYFDRGADRIEIGEQLREPEREWLAAQLQSWSARD